MIDEKSLKEIDKEISNGIMVMFGFPIYLMTLQWSLYENFMTSAKNGFIPPR